MASVCQYLAELCQADSNIHCRRMLSICSEFERIARVALEKAEREMRSRGKRKASQANPEEAARAKSELRQHQGPPTTMQPPQVPSMRTPNMSSAYLPQNTPTTASMLQSQPPSPYAQQAFNNIPFSGASQPPYQTNGDVNGQHRFDQPFPGNLSAFSQGPGGIPASMFGQDALGVADYNNWGGGDMGLNGGSFQQPFVPQDLWQMPMTLEWDWADVLNTSSSGFNFDDMGGLNDGHNQ